MPAQKKADQSAEISVLKVNSRTIKFHIIGSSPMIFNAVSEKAKRELLYPKGRMTTADKAANIKHDPVMEYKNSVYRSVGANAPTRLIFPSTAFKKGLMTAALDMPGNASKAKIGRLTWVEGTHVNIYGVPSLMMGIVRMADIGRTPDVRTRAILTKWAATVEITFISPMLKEESLSDLFQFSGLICGIGDFRQEKGSGNFGQFYATTPDDPEYMDIIANGGVAAQDAALNTDNPPCFDSETENLLAWWKEQRETRGSGDPKAATKRGRKPLNGSGDEAYASV